MLDTFPRLEETTIASSTAPKINSSQTIELFRGPHGRIRRGGRRRRGIPAIVLWIHGRAIVKGSSNKNSFNRPRIRNRNRFRCFVRFSA